MIPISLGNARFTFKEPLDNTSNRLQKKKNVTALTFEKMLIKTFNLKKIQGF